MPENGSQTEYRDLVDGAVEQLKRQTVHGADQEIAHAMCDDILLDFLDRVAPDISKAFRHAKETVGFWYA